MSPNRSLARTLPTELADNNQGPTISRKDTRPVGRVSLQDKCPLKGTCPALISTCPFSEQFILKESQNSDFFPPILVDYKS